MWSKNFTTWPIILSSRELRLCFFISFCWQWTPLRLAGKSSLSLQLKYPFLLWFSLRLLFSSREFSSEGIEMQVWIWSWPTSLISSGRHCYLYTSPCNYAIIISQNASEMREWSNFDSWGHHFFFRFCQPSIIVNIADHIVNFFSILTLYFAT